MLAKIRRHLASKHSYGKESSSYGGGGNGGGGDDDDNDDLHTFTPPTNYIKISQGKIQLVNQSKLLDNDSTTTTTNESHSQKDKQLLENRIHELEGALKRLQTKVDKNSESGSPIFEKELREQLESMNRVIKSKDRKQQQTCRDHKVLQLRFTQQEQLLQTLQQENKALIIRVRQYEHCLDDVMRKVVDAIVAEDNLREEVAMLKSRVRDLEAQNAQLSGGSPAKGRDEGYCTMSSGQPQPSNGHLEDLPEEPEQWLLPAEPCSTEMEDWSMSQEELAVMTLDEEREQQYQHQHQNQNQHHQQQHQHFQGSQRRRNGESDWLWNSQDFLNSTLIETDSVSDGISQLLQQKIIYSEDEEIACTDFTNDFYKLVNIRSSSARSLYSCIEGDTDDEDDDEDDDDDDSSLCSNNIKNRLRLRSSRNSTRRRGGEGGEEAEGRDGKVASPTPSEAGRAQVTSCSSSDTDERSLCAGAQDDEQQQQHTEEEIKSFQHDNTTQQIVNDIEEEDVEQADDDDRTDVHIDSDIELENDNEANHHHHHQQQQQHQLPPNIVNEKQCIAEYIKTELRRPPHILVKSKSTIDEEEPSCILRNNQRREIETGVVRSGSINCAIAAKIVASTQAAASVTAASNSSSKGSAHHNHQGRFILDQRPQNSWRKSNGWKRVTSPTQSPVVSPKKETTTTTSSRSLMPTRIPTCVVTALPTTATTTTYNGIVSTTPTAAGGLRQQTSITTTTTPQNAQQQANKQQRKSKIPPPVPVRRSYAS